MNEQTGGRWRANEWFPLLTAPLIASFLLLGAITLWASRNLGILQSGNLLVAHTESVRIEISNVLQLLTDIETATRGYALARDKEFLEPYSAALPLLAPALENLKHLVQDNPKQSLNVARLKSSEQICVAYAANLVQRVERGDSAAVRRMISSGEGKRRMDAVRAVAAQMQSEEARLLESRRTSSELALRSTKLVLWMTYAVTVFLLFIIAYSARRYEARIRRGEQTLATTLRSVGDAVISTDALGAVQFMNAMAEKLTGWNQKDARGRPLNEVFRIVNEQTRETVDSPIAKVLRDGTIVNLANHTVLIARDGSERPIDDSGAPIMNAYGVLVGVVLVFHDISARREAEKRQSESYAESVRLHELNRAIVTNMGEGLYTVNTQGLVTFINPAAERMFGWESGELLGQKMHELTHYKRPDGSPFPIEECAGFKVLHEGESLLDFEDTFIRKDGSFFPVMYGSSPLRIGGETVGLVVVFRDMTAHKKAELHLRQLASSLTEADRRKDDFLAILAHELRNPLAPIRTAARLLETPGLGAQQLERSRAIISRQVRHMAVLLDDLLDVSRITRGVLLLKKEYVDLQDVMTIAIETARPSIDAKHHELVLEWPSAPIRVYADPIRLAQVAANLLTNAAKYTDPGGCITFGIRASPTEITIFVRDTGVGISADMLTKIFEMFTQVEADKPRSEGGLGIGLALVNGLVGLHGGRVEARSAGPNMGSELLIVLPTSRIASDDAEPKLTRTDSRHPARSRRILISDDNRDGADSLALFLQRSGHEVFVAYAGPDTLKVAEAERPDACIIDIGMPGMSGYEVAQRIRRETWGAQMLLIAVTGWGQERDKSDALTAGFDHHLTKPMDLQALEEFLVLPGVAAALDG